MTRRSLVGLSRSLPSSLVADRLLEYVVRVSGGHGSDTLEFINRSFP